MTIEEKQDLIQKVNQYNFDGLAQIFYFDRPQEIAKKLLSVYFKLSQYIVSDTERECSTNYDLQDGMYYLQSIYEAILQLDNVNDACLKFTIK